MRSTITIDDKLFAQACKELGDDNASNVVTAALQAYIKAAAAKRLVLLGGTAPGFKVPGYVGDQRLDKTSEGLIAAEDPTPYNA